MYVCMYVCMYYFSTALMCKASDLSPSTYKLCILSLIRVPFLISLYIYMYYFSTAFMCKASDLSPSTYKLCILSLILVPFLIYLYICTTIQPRSCVRLQISAHQHISYACYCTAVTYSFKDLIIVGLTCCHIICRCGLILISSCVDSTGEPISNIQKHNGMCKIKLKKLITSYSVLDRNTRNAGYTGN